MKYLRLKFIAVWILCKHENLFYLIFSPVRKYGQRSFVEVHDWIICALVTVDHWVGVEPNDQIVSFLGTFLKEVQMADVEQVELQKGAGLI